FIGVLIVSLLLTFIPFLFVYTLSNMSIGIKKGDSIKVIEEKINNYFEGNGLTQDIINSMRKNPTGNFNIYSLNPNSDDFNEIEKNMKIICPQALELNRLEKGKKYNIKVYSDYYEREKKVNTEELLSKDIIGTESMHIIYGDKFMEGGSKRDMKIHLIQNKEIIDTIQYYCPTNYNESAIIQDADFNINEDIPIMSFTKGYKINEKYKTYSPALHKSKGKIEKSIKEVLSKNEKLVILRLEVNDIY
ncbi:MAG: hypothetical protein RSE41_08810, partial [Clostridia bacterium]